MLKKDVIEQEYFEVNDSPEEIWLVYGDIEKDTNHYDCDDVLWCSDQQYNSDVKYIRADIVKQQAAEIAALRAVIKSMVDSEAFDDEYLFDLGLLDEDINPTKLLTGDASE